MKLMFFKYHNFINTLTLAAILDNILMRYRNTLNEEDYNNRNRELHARIDKGEKLTREEEAFVCHTLRYDNLLLHPFCLDEFFSRTFLARNSEVPKEMYAVRERDHITYEGLVREWAGEMYKTNHTDQLMQIVAIETREELKSLRKKYTSLHRTFTSHEYQKRKFKLLEWSKYRYIMIKDVFELSIQSDHYKLYLNEHEIIFDYYSLTHILTRHYGQLMKTYDTDKSHFTQDVHHEEVHLQIEKIFKQIDASKLYVNDSVKEVNIRLNGTLYKIFIDEETKGGTKVFRLNSFFPTVNNKMLLRLEKEFEEKKIDANLSIFVRKNGG
jgi:hypothetical protein